MKKSNKILFSALGIALVIGLCQGKNPLSFSQKIVTSNGEITTQMRTVSTVEKVNVQGAFDVTIVPGTAPALKITADKNILPWVVTQSQSGNVLNIHMSPNVSTETTQPIQVVLTENTVNAVATKGNTILYMPHVNTPAFTLTMRGHTKGVISGAVENVQVDASGHTELHMALQQTKNVNVSTRGNSMIVLSGSSDQLILATSGNTDIDAKGLRTNDAIITTRGRAHVLINAVNQLTVNAMGLSDVQYYGNPSIIKHITGMATVEQVQ